MKRSNVMGRRTSVMYDKLSLTLLSVSLYYQIVCLIRYPIKDFLPFALFTVASGIMKSHRQFRNLFVFAPCGMRGGQQQTTPAELVKTGF